MIAPSEKPASSFVIRSWQRPDDSAVADLYWRGRLCGHSDTSSLPDDVADIAGHYFNRPQDHLWVATLDDRIVGCVAVVGVVSHVASLRRLRLDPGWRQRSVLQALLQTAVEHCRANCILKLVVESPIDRREAVALLEELGLQASPRQTRLPEAQSLEFYLNLYMPPRRDSLKLTEQPSRRPSLALREHLAHKLARALHARCDAWAFASLTALLPRLLASLDEAVQRSGPEREGFVRQLVHQEALPSDSIVNPSLDALALIINAKLAQLQRILQRPGVCLAPSTWFG